MFIWKCLLSWFYRDISLGSYILQTIGVFMQEYYGGDKMEKLKCDCCSNEFMRCELQEDEYCMILCKTCFEKLAREEYIDRYDDSYLDYVED